MIGAPNCTRCAAYSRASLVRRLGDPDRLRRDAEPRVVHEIEHGAEALPAARRAGTPRRGRTRSRRWASRGCRASSRRARRGCRSRRPSGSVVGQSIRLRPLVVPFDWSKVAASRASTRWTVRAAVGDEDLLAVDEVAIVLAASTRVTMPPRSEPACGSVRSMQPCSSPDDEARAGSAACSSSLPYFSMSSATPACRPMIVIRLESARDDHLEVGAVDQRRQAVAAVLGAHACRQSRPGGAQLLVAGGDVRRHDDLRRRRAAPPRASGRARPRRSPRRSRRWCGGSSL